MRDLHAGFQALGHEVITLVPWTEGAEEKEIDEEAGLVRRIHCGDRGLFFGDGMEANARRIGAMATFRALRASGRAMRDALAAELSSSDLVLAHWLVPGAWWCARAAERAGRRLIAIAHGGDAHFVARPFAGRLASARLRGRLHAVAAVSAHARELVAARLGLAPGRIAVVPMGIDARVFSPAPGMPREARLVAAAGRLVPIKGYDVLVSAAAIAGARVVIAGEGPERARLQDLARLLGVALELPGNLLPEGIADLFRRAAVVAVPSRRLADQRVEGTPVAALEALACGAAVVGTRTGGVPDVLDPRALVEPDDPAALARAFEHAFANPVEFRQENAARRFDRSVAAARVLGVV